MDASATDGMAFWTRPLHSAFSPLLSTGGNASPTSLSPASLLTLAAKRG